jgi:pimeloyl-ACP methyl ester carboxylesterase
MKPKLFLFVPLLLSLFINTKNISANDAASALPSYHPFKSAEAQEEYLAFNDTLSKKWPVAGETKMVETSFGKTFIRICGPLNARPLVLLPGGGANSLMWRTNVKPLSEHFRVYAVDNINDFGRSIYSHAPKSPDDFSLWLGELFSQLNLGDSITIMGTSYGGWIAGQYAMRNPQHLAKVVLLAPAATVLPIRMEFILRALFSVINRNFSRSFFNWVFADLVKKDENGRLRVEEVLEESALSTRCFKPIKLVVPTVLKDEELLRLQQTSTLFVVGEHEKLYSPKKAIERLNKVAFQIKTALIPGAGHDLTVTQADLVDSIVVDFLEK